MADLPSGTVTFLSTDTQGSTARWERDRTAMAAVERHFELLDTAIKAHGGIYFRAVGGAIQVAFSAVPQAESASVAEQRTLVAEDCGAAEGMRLRMALHTGEPSRQPGGREADRALRRVPRLSRHASGRGART
jgi:class 3 adenylate cyclase